MTVHNNTNFIDKIFKCDATQCSLTSVTSFVDEILTSVNASQKEIMSLNIVIDELFSNIIKYAYKDRKTPGEAIVKVNIEIDTRKVTLFFMDNGPKFNPLENDLNIDITKSAEERDIGGLGIFIVKNTTDELTYEYSNNYNVVRVVKYLSK